MELWEKSLIEFEKLESGLRPRRLFEWLNNSYHYLYLSSVPQDYVPILADAKTALCMVDVSVDDACDNAELIKRNGGEEFTYALLDLLFNVRAILDGNYQTRFKDITQVLDNKNNKGCIYYQTTYHILEEIVQTVRQFPRFEEFKQHFIYGLRSVGKAMEFSYLVNRDKIVYPISHIILHRSPSTMVFLHSLLDLMVSNNFDKKENGKVFSLFSMADTVSMLGNTLNTWYREIIEKDFSSPMLALGLERGIINFEEFNTGNIKEIEKKLLPLSQEIEKMADEEISKMKIYTEAVGIQSFDAQQFVNNYSKVKEAFKAREKYWEKN
ncbi:MAG: hypothetical protein HY051_00505 [Candidatus Aenigmarchaeota archaeon]|nr:hypothetical protein [Candidatus Aenigmarchaeota archaeon]